MNCTNCGEELKTGANFCGNCGQPVDKKEDESLKDRDMGETRVFDSSLLNKEEEKELNTDDTVVRGVKIEEDSGYLDQDQELEAYDDQEDMDATRVIDPVGEYLDEDDYYGEDDEYYDEDDDEENFMDKIRDNKGILIGLGIGLLALIIILMVRGGGSSAKEDLIEDFIGALAARDVSDTRKMLQSPLPDLRVDNAGVEALFQYIDENPSFIDQTKTELERQSKFYDDNKDKDLGEITSNVSLRRRDKNEYFLEITPYYMDISVGAKDTKIFIGGKEVATADSENYSKQFGPFMPGIYKIGAKYQADYANLETDKLVELIDDRPDSSKQIKEFKLEMNVSFITIVTEHEDARLVINGEKTGKKVSDLESGKLGPVDGNTRVKLLAETPFGEFESPEFIVGESGDRIEVDITMINDSVKEDVMKAVNQFIEDDLKAKEKLTMDPYTNLINPEKDKITIMIDNMKTEGYNIESDLKKIRYDLDSIAITKHEGRYFSGADVNYDVVETYLWEFTTETNEESKNINIYLRFDEASKKWQVFELESSTTFNEANVKEFTF